jgi:hypothetical protein
MSAVLELETPIAAARRLTASQAAQGYKPDALHEYRAADGSPLYWRIRMSHPTKPKWIRPMHRDGSRFVLGEPQASANGKPVYRLPELGAADPSVPVLIVEGEKCADALAQLGVVATTSGGASSADAADWSPLSHRMCIVWPDHDKAGAAYGLAVALKLRALGCTVELVDVSNLHLPDGGDCVDWLAVNPNATAADMSALRMRPANAEPTTARVASDSRDDPVALPSPLPSVPTFDGALLPDSVRTWCEDAAEGLQVPLDFTAIPAAIALAGAIGRCVGIAMKRNQHWIERPMLWGCVVGRPSSGKSPALYPARRMLERLAGEERVAFDARMREYEGLALIADASKANARKAIQAALKKGDRLAAAAEADAALFDEDAPTEPRVVVNDATVEKLGELLNANPRGLVQFRDELAGWLASLDREGRECDRAFWLECWNGTGAFTVDRIGRGTIRIDACAMSILGGMQPGKLAEYVRGAVRGGFADDGLIQRFQLAVYPDLPADWSYTDRAPDPRAEARAWSTFRALRALDPESVGAVRADWADVPFLRFDDEAQELLVEWMTAHMRRLRAGGEPPWIESHLAKYPALVGRLALVLHLSDAHTGDIAADTLARALDWCVYLEAHARRIYAPAAENGLTGAHLLLKRRADLPERFTARDVYRRGWVGVGDAEAATAALDTLVEYGHLRTVDSVPGECGGRPSVVYEWRRTR